MRIPVIVHDLYVQRPNPAEGAQPMIQVVSTYYTEIGLKKALEFALKQRTDRELLIDPTTEIKTRSRTQEVEVESIDHAISQGYKVDYAAVSEVIRLSQLPPTPEPEPKLEP